MVHCGAMTFGYGRKKLFENLSLDLAPGAVYGLLGLNGAGKTSLLKLLAGALRPEAGAISCFGRNPGARQAAFLADVAFVPEDPWLPPLKPGQWLNRYAVFRPAFDRARFQELLLEFNIDEDKVLTSYSYGQRKKFALAAAMASGARLLLLDEPTNGLDIPSKTQFRRMLVGIAAADRVVIVSTHQVRDLESLIDPLIIVESGRILCTLAQADILAKLSTVMLNSLDGPGIVHAEKNAAGWAALVDARCGGIAGRIGEPLPADIELLFNAAVANPSRLLSVMNSPSESRAELSAYSDGPAISTREATL